MVQTTAEPVVVPSELTTGAPDPKPNPSVELPARDSVGSLDASTPRLYARKRPVPGTKPDEAVGMYTRPPSPAHTAGCDHAPPYGPIRSTTASPPPGPCPVPPSESRFSR